MAEVKTACQDTFWLGGSPCCGKSSVAEILSREFELGYYKCDDGEKSLEGTAREVAGHFGLTNASAPSAHGDCSRL